MGEKVDDSKWIFLVRGEEELVLPVCVGLLVLCARKKDTDALKYGELY